MEVFSLTQAATRSPELEPRAASSQEMSQFLQLLTAQIQNQDPMEPMEANQFIEQLATINNLEQQIAANGHLEEIVSLLRDS
jgi:flagellar basal-body rod modification protein FlgD